MPHEVSSSSTARRRPSARRLVSFRFDLRAGSPMTAYLAAWLGSKVCARKLGSGCRFQANITNRSRRANRYESLTRFFAQKSHAPGTNPLPFQLLWAGGSLVADQGTPPPRAIDANRTPPQTERGRSVGKLLRDPARRPGPGWPPRLKSKGFNPKIKASRASGDLASKTLALLNRRFGGSRSEEV
jgi:hypothetical protein